MTNNHIKINKCIYCGGLGETDEHIIPFSLGGTDMLLKASCEKCRKKTEECESNTLKHHWSEVRALLKTPSRRGKLYKRSSSLDVILEDGTETTLSFKNSESLGLLPFLEFPLPAFFNPEGYEKGSRIKGTRLLYANPDYKKILKEKGVKTIKPTIFFKGCDFEKMVIKIAYCYVIQRLGIDGMEECFVLPTINGERDDVGRWMGCDFEEKITPSIGKRKCINAMKMDISEEGYIAVRIRFFAGFNDVPEYIIIVGKIKGSE